MSWLHYLQSEIRAINRWLIAGPFTEPVASPPVTLTYTGDLNDWLTKGLDAFVHPARQTLSEGWRALTITPPDVASALPGNELVYQDQMKHWTLYFPWENPAVDLSGFWYQPTHLYSWATTWLVCPTAHEARFRISTCGGARIWVNGVLATHFHPFTRNRESEAVFTAALREGNNELLIYFEDMAERDIRYRFQLDYLGTEQVAMQLPMTGFDPVEVKQLEETLGAAAFATDTVTQGEILLDLFQPLQRDLEIHVTHEVEWSTSASFTLHAPARARQISLGRAEDYEAGLTFFTFTAQLGAISVQTKRLLQIYPRSWMNLTGANIEERRQRCLQLVADYGKQDAQRAYALAKLGRASEQIEAIVLAELQRVEARLDCSDFALTTLLRFWHEFRSSGRFGAALWERFEQVVLNYRYWFDEPGSDVMWFFSENHALLFHTSELLAGQLFPDKIFPNSGLSGAEHHKHALALLEPWFERFFREGPVEWNSIPYLPLDVMGLLDLYDLAESSFIRQAASSALDSIFRSMAANSFEGVLGGTQGRTYEKDVKNSYANATTALLWLAWGTGYANNASFGVVSFCASTYTLPENAAQLALMQGIDEYVFQAHHGPPDYADLYTYRTRWGLLSSAPGFRPGRPGYSEQVLQATLGPESLIFVTHPGEKTRMGSGRPGYFAGNGVLPHALQYRGFAALFFQLPPEHEVPFTHAYFPTFSFDQVAHEANWWFGARGDAYVAIYAANGLTLRADGPDRMRELVSPGLSNTWLLRIGHKKEFQSFEHFVSTLKQAALHTIAGETLKYCDPRYGHLTASWQGTLSVNDLAQEYTGHTSLGTLIY